MHLYRLLSECRELLETGHITLPRPDSEFLLEIRNGSFTYDELMLASENFQAGIESTNSFLQEKPNRKDIETLYLSIVRNNLI